MTIRNTSSRRHRRRDSHDPYNTLLRDFLKAARLDQDAKRGAVASLVERPDPLIFEEIGARLSMTKLSGEGVIFFDGINYPIRDNPEILSAYKLVPCGWDCVVMIVILKLSYPAQQGEVALQVDLK